MNYQYIFTKILYFSTMKRYRQFQSIVVSDFEVEEWKHPVHNHNHYELIYIKKGLGVHYINKECVPYAIGNVFLLGPEEEHYFEVIEPSGFIYLKFTEPYLSNAEHGMEIKDLEFLIKKREARLTNFELSSIDQIIVDHIFNVIISSTAELKRNERLIWLQVIALAFILKQNITGQTKVIKPDKNMEDIYSYIHEHIYTPEKLNASNMANQFNIAKNYIGPYFKRNTGITLREYISKYRSTLMAKRRKGKNYSLKQIASEFGLTDESHVSKILRKQSQ